MGALLCNAPINYAMAAGVIVKMHENPSGKLCVNFPISLVKFGEWCYYIVGLYLAWLCYADDQAIFSGFLFVYLL